jgi:lipopolysaccharide/colanic/teichoic acid biosynthesis glycosyltransferase
VTVRPSPYPGSIRRISYKELRLLIPPDTYVAPTHPVTPAEKVLKRLEGFFDSHAPTTYVLATNSTADLDLLIDPGAKAIVNLRRANDIRYLNKFFEAVHTKLSDGGHFVICVETLRLWRRRVRLKYPWGIAHLYMGVTFILKRVLPKLPLTRGLYFEITKGHNRLITRAETMGRLYSCGFEVVGMRRIDHLTFLIARKVKNPAFDMSPTYGPIVRMRRVGKDGRPMSVYKLRTMFPYSEYLQQYIYERNSLRTGGKFNADFRVTPWGAFLRRYWIDELPMLYNWIRGDLKLVGVRPLSAQYESLYPEDARELRRRSTPGMIPPFYADMPKTFDEIVESERRYLNAYHRSPWLTDVRYLFSALTNILFRGARSA